MNVSVLYRSDELSSAPDWVEVDGYDFGFLDQEDANRGVVRLTAAGPRDLVLVISGELRLANAGGRITLKRYDWTEFSGEIELSAVRVEGAEHRHFEYLHVRGSWNEINVVSIFNFRPDRPLETHYHDFNEYWFLFRGSPSAFVGDESHELRPGELMAIRAGHEHGMHGPDGVVEGVALSTERIGRKRPGHLHRDRDGDPEPR